MEMITHARTKCRFALLWRHNGHDGVSNHQPRDSLLNRLFKKTSKFRFTGLCVGKSPVTGEFPAQMASNAENDSIWWRHHVISALHESHGIFHIQYNTYLSPDHLHN